MASACGASPKAGSAGANHPVVLSKGKDRTSNRRGALCDFGTASILMALGVVLCSHDPPDRLRKPREILMDF